jgi:threonine synthase
MVMAVAKAIESGSRVIMCASTGNTSASAAAYGARFNLTTIVLVPKGDVAEGKLAQAIAYGAKILMLDGKFDDTLVVARSFAQRHQVTLVNSVNPYRLEGQKTAAFEIVDTLGEAPDYLFIPVGNAGNITAYWQGFCQYMKDGKAGQTPHMMGIQAEGSAPIVIGAPVSQPTTVASAIRIGNPASWNAAVAARDQSGGTIDMVTDEEILEAHRLLASREGIFCEPASAASFAGLVKLNRMGLSLSGQRVVCVITGSGLKDRDVVTQHFKADIKETAPNLQEVEAAVMELVS